MLVHRLSTDTECMLALCALNCIRGLRPGRNNTSTYIDPDQGKYLLQASDLSQAVQVTCAANPSDDVACKAALVELAEVAKEVISDETLSRLRAIPAAEEITSVVSEFDLPRDTEH